MNIPDSKPKLKRILDLTYKLCKHSDVEVAVSAAEANQLTFELLKEIKLNELSDHIKQ